MFVFHIFHLFQISFTKVAFVLVYYLLSQTLSWLLWSSRNYARATNIPFFGDFTVSD